jgi:hypothetical protein
LFDVDGTIDGMLVGGIRVDDMVFVGVLHVLSLLVGCTSIDGAVFASSYLLDCIFQDSSWLSIPVTSMPWATASDIEPLVFDSLKDFTEDA